MTTQPLPIAGKLPIKTLVAKQLPTNDFVHDIVYITDGCIHTHTHTQCHVYTHTQLNRDNSYLERYKLRTSKPGRLKWRGRPGTVGGKLARGARGPPGIIVSGER